MTTTNAPGPNDLLDVIVSPSRGDRMRTMLSIVLALTHDARSGLVFGRAGGLIARVSSDDLAANHPCRDAKIFATWISSTRGALGLCGWRILSRRGTGGNTYRIEPMFRNDGTPKVLTSGDFVAASAVTDDVGSDLAFFDFERLLGCVVREVAGDHPIGVVYTSPMLFEAMSAEESSEHDLASPAHVAQKIRRYRALLIERGWALVNKGRNRRNQTVYSITAPPIITDEELDGIEGARVLFVAATTRKVEVLARMSSK